MYTRTIVVLAVVALFAAILCSGCSKESSADPQAQMINLIKVVEEVDPDFTDGVFTVVEVDTTEIAPGIRRFFARRESDGWVYQVLTTSNPRLGDEVELFGLFFKSSAGSFVSYAVFQK